MWVKQCHTPAMTGNSNLSTNKNGDDWGTIYGIVLPALYQLLYQPTIPDFLPGYSLIDVIVIPIQLTISTIHTYSYLYIYTYIYIHT